MHAVNPPTNIPGYQVHKEEMSEIANVGFVLALNYTFGSGPQYMDCTYPHGWFTEYNEGNYAIFDPTVVVNIASPGTRRWSDLLIHFGDVTGIFQKAKKYSLNYGATICQRSKFGLSFITVARSDRDLTDDELKFLEVKLENLREIVTGEIILSELEVKIVNLLSFGNSQEDISSNMNIPTSTIKNKIQGLKKTLNAENSTEIVAQCIRRKLI